MAIKVFLDSDVIISSLLSTSGAAHQLLENTSIKFIVSDISVKELKIVATRLNISADRLIKLIDNYCQVIKLKTSSRQPAYQDYVLHQGDSHIVSGAHQAKVDFLVSYNTKHFKINKINRDFDITTLSPGHFLQYLRSLN